MSGRRLRTSFRIRSSEVVYLRLSGYATSTCTAIIFWVVHAVANPSFLARLDRTTFAKVHLIAVATKAETVVPTRHIPANRARVSKNTRLDIAPRALPMDEITAKAQVSLRPKPAMTFVGGRISKALGVTTANTFASCRFASAKNVRGVPALRVACNARTAAPPHSEVDEAIVVR